MSSLLEAPRSLPWVWPCISQSGHKMSLLKTLTGWCPLNGWSQLTSEYQEVSGFHNLHCKGGVGAVGGGSPETTVARISVNFFLIKGRVVRSV